MNTDPHLLLATPFRLQRVTLRLERQVGPTIQIADTQTIVAAFRDLVHEPRESLYALYLSPAKAVITYERVSSGGLMTTAAEPAEVARTALLTAACAVVLVHSHPAGDPRPSPEDRTVTLEIARALALFQITLLDHVILAPEDFYSFRAMGALPLLPTANAAQGLYAVTWHGPDAAETVLEHVPLTPRQADALHDQLQALADTEVLRHPAIKPVHPSLRSYKALCRTHPALRHPSNPSLSVENA